MEVDTQGDAFFVAFPTAAGAVAAAASGQRALAPGPITVRMGLHTGTPDGGPRRATSGSTSTAARGSPHSPTAARSIVSATTAALVGDEPLRDLGRHRLKDFDAPAQLFQLGTSEFPPLRTPGAVDLPDSGHSLPRS